MTTAAPGSGIRRFLSRFSRLTIAVWGDFVADEFLVGEIARVSREAPVLILKRRRRAIAAGGGANAIANLAALGVQVRAIGLLGDDESGAALRRLFTRWGVATGGVLTLRGRPTPTKTRVLAHHPHTSPQQVVRIDFEPPPPPASAERWLARAARRALRGADALLVSDYGYGAVSPAAAAVARRLLPPPHLVAVDARYQIGAYRGASAATPNEAELEVALNCRVSAPEKLERAGRRLRSRLGCAHLLVTRGRDGMALFEPGRRTRHWPVFGSQQALDVTGAGDTVVAVFTAALAAGASGAEAAELANCAGGLVVMKPGTATVTRSELGAALAASGS